jgi:hypothetical protein
MNEPNWSRAYYAVFVCACVAIVATTLSVANVGARTRAWLLGEGQAAPICKVFLEIPVPVYYVVGASAIVLIGLLGIYRQRPLSVILTTALVTLCVCFNTVAVWSLQLALYHKLFPLYWASGWRP